MANAEWEAKIAYLNKNWLEGISAFLELTSLGFGSAELVLHPYKKYLNAEGKVRGVMQTVLLEQAACVAAMSWGRYITPEQLSLNYHKPCDDGRLRAVASEQHRGRYLGVYRVDVFDEQEDVVASGTMTLYFQEKEIPWDNI